ncbi:MAG: DUF2062 domain-containing protein [Candidatus Puniceispirillaceae bacterium]
MFRRRTPLTRLRQIRSVIWPERGFRRLFAYLFQRVVRLPGTSGSIAIGVASGVAASFLPFIGLHFLIAALLALLLRGNVLASAIGTFFGNPWTFLFIWVSDYRLGLWLLKQSGHGDQFVALNLQQLAEVMTVFMHFFTFSGGVDWQQVAGPFEQVFLPMTIGGTVLAILSWVVAFVLCYYSFEWWRAHRAKRLANASKLVKSRKKTGQ